MLVLYLLAVLTRVIIVERNYGEPFDCTRYGLKGVMATSKNRDSLVKLLKTAGISSAAVCGWDGVQQELVLRDTGNVAPYDPNTNPTGYSFCTTSRTTRDLPMSPLFPARSVIPSANTFPASLIIPSANTFPAEQNGSCVPVSPFEPRNNCFPPFPPTPFPCDPCIPICPPEPCIPICPPNPRYPFFPPCPEPSFPPQQPCIPICPPGSRYPLEISSCFTKCNPFELSDCFPASRTPQKEMPNSFPFSCSWERLTNTLPKYPCHQYTQKSKVVDVPPPTKLNGTTNGAKRLVSLKCNETSRMFVLSRDNCGPDAWGFKMITTTKQIRTEIFQTQKIRPSQLSPSPFYPVIIDNPRFIFLFFEYLQKCCRITNPCVYTDVNSNLYVRNNGILYYAYFGPVFDPSKTTAFPNVRFVPITGRRLCDLIQSGLFQVLFDGYN